jgi:hypothetical protein
MTESRRTIFISHAQDHGKVTRCPVCRWAIERDHDEALVMAASMLVPAPFRTPKATRRIELNGEEAAAECGFALVS